MMRAILITSLVAILTAFCGCASLPSSTTITYDRPQAAPMPSPELPPAMVYAIEDLAASARAAEIEALAATEKVDDTIAR